MSHAPQAQSSEAPHRSAVTVVRTPDGRTMQLLHPDHHSALQRTGPLRRALLSSSTTGLQLLSGVACHSEPVPKRPATLPLVRESKRPRSISAPSLAVDDLQALDWEYVVKMYLTGEGTVDGRPLRDMKRGSGAGSGNSAGAASENVGQERSVDRKKLEKQKTVGKTFEALGRETFEKAVGYKYEGNSRRKQRMYQVIARCRIISGMRKQGEPIPEDADELAALIDRRLYRKEAAKRS